MTCSPSRRSTAASADGTCLTAARPGTTCRHRPAAPAGAAAPTRSPSNRRCSLHRPAAAATRALSGDALRDDQPTARLCVRRSSTSRSDDSRSPSGNGFASTPFWSMPFGGDGIYVYRIQNIHLDGFAAIQSQLIDSLADCVQNHTLLMI